MTPDRSADTDVIAPAPGGGVARPPSQMFHRFPETAIDRPVFDLFTDAVAAFGDACAIDDGERRLSFRELHERAVALAHRVAAPGNRRKPIGVALTNSVSMPVATLAALATGRPYLPFDLTFPEARNRFIIEHSGITTIIVDETTRAAAAHLAPALEQIDIADAAVGSHALPPTSADDIAFLSYTSGSEGRPKGVFFTQRSLLHNTIQRINTIEMSPADRKASLFSPTDVTSQRLVFGTLLAGARLHMLDLRRQGLREIIRLLQSGAITIFYTPPFIFRRLLDLCREPEIFASVRYVQLGGDRVFASDVALFRRRFPQSSRLGVCMASSEAGSFCHGFIDFDTPLDRPLVPVGRVQDGYEIAIADDDRNRLPPGEVGEITVTGRFLSEGYWNDEELTGRAFTVSAADAEARIFRTGDLGLIRNDGQLEFLGRKDRQFKIRGQRVEPDEIEAALRSYPGIHDAAIVARGEGDAREIAAYVVRVEGETVTTRALSAWLADRLPAAMRPRHLYVIDEIPRLPGFKPDLQKLRDRDLENATQSTNGNAGLSTEGEDATGAVVRACWCPLFGAASFAADEGWEEAGGDSLKALEFILELELRLGRPLSTSVLAPATRPSDLIARLKQETADHAHPDVYFLPGWRGAVLHAMRCVQELEKGCTVAVLEYPRLDPLNLRAHDKSDIAVSFLGQLRDAARDGTPIRLLGYSFGADIAFECACLLAEEGIDVAFLGLIDAPAIQRRASGGGHAAAPRPWRWAGWVWTLLSRPGYAGIRIVEELLRRRRFSALAWIWRLLVFVRAPHACVVFQDIVMNELRAKAASGPGLRHYPGRACIFRASETWYTTDMPDARG